jgi:hypothetical protein
MPKDKETDPAEPQPEPQPEPKPEPKPGEAGYDWAKLYGTDNLYLHTFPNGTVVALKPFGSIYSKTWLFKLRALQTDVDIEFAALDRGSCPVAKEVLMGLDDKDGDPLDELFKAWAASATEGLKPGE